MVLVGAGFDDLEGEVLEFGEQRPDLLRVVEQGLPVGELVRGEPDGKTATRILTDDPLAGYRPWFDNYRRLRELITELESLSLAIAEADPRWNR